MIRSLWTFVQDTPDLVDAARVQRSVIRLAVTTSGAEAYDALVATLGEEAARELGEPAQHCGSRILVASSAGRDFPIVRTKYGTTRVVIIAPNEPIDIDVEDDDDAIHVVRIPNAPLHGEAVVALRMCARISYPNVLDL